MTAGSGGGSMLVAPYESPIARGQVRQIPTQIDQPGGDPVGAEIRFEDKCIRGIGACQWQFDAVRRRVKN